MGRDDGVYRRLNGQEVGMVFERLGGGTEAARLVGVGAAREAGVIQRLGTTVNKIRSS